MNQEMLERMSLNEILAIDIYLLHSSDQLLLYRELIWRLRPMVFSSRADKVIRKVELAESILCRKLELFDKIMNFNGNDGVDYTDD